MDYKENLLVTSKDHNTNLPLAHYVQGLASGANAVTAIKIAEAFPEYDWRRCVVPTRSILLLINHF